MEKYFVWYVTSELFLLVTIVLWPKLYISLPKSPSDVDGTLEARRTFAEIISMSFYPLAREFMFISGFFSRVATRIFPLQ